MKTNGSSVALSPDGTKLVYVAEQAGKSQLYLQEIGEMKATPIPARRTDSPFLSPDGQWVAFDDRKLKKVSLLGGPPLDSATVLVTGAHWGLDDTILSTHLAEASGAGYIANVRRGGNPRASPPPKLGGG